MACDVCPPDLVYSNVPIEYDAGSCTGCEPCPVTVDASCITYSGPPLICSQVSTGVCVETVLLELDKKMCSIGAGPFDFQGYDLKCFRERYPIANLQQFAEAVADYSCKLHEDVEVLTVDVTNKYNTLDTWIQTILNIGISSCPLANIQVEDNLLMVVNKLKNNVCSIYDLINPSQANWRSCFTLSGTVPYTVTEGFNKILEYLCQLKSDGGSSQLPVFDNTGSCIPGTATDSLQDTVTKMRDRLCQTPVFNASRLVGGCVQIKADDSLEMVLSGFHAKVSDISRRAVIEVNTDHFILQDIDPTNACLGKRLSLNAVTDSKVAVNGQDNAPGSLSEKLVAGSGITLDVSNPARMVISSSGTTSKDEMVKTSSQDTASGYLNDKITGSSGMVSISTSISNNKLQLSGNLDMALLIDRFMDIITNTPEIYKQFCELVRGCPSPCSAPSNVQIVLA